MATLDRYPGTSAGTNVKAAVTSACRRRLFVLSVQQLALAFALLLAGCLLMLLLGTQILDWYWLAALAVVGLALVGFRLREHLLPPYRVAQIVDERLSLQDSLSTAWFLTKQPDQANPAIAFLEIARADALAASIQPATAFPFVGGRVWLLTGALAIAAIALFGVRYFVTDSLSLRPALVPLNFKVVLETLVKPFTAPKPALPLAVDSDARDAASPQSGKAETQAHQTGEARADNASDSQAAAAANEPQNNSGTLDQSASKQSGDSQAAARRDGGPNPDPSATSPADAAPKTAETKETSAKDGNPAQQQASSGLMDKMKDALNSLMAKMRPNSSLQNSQHGSEHSSQQQSASEQNSAKPGQSQSQNNQNEQASSQQSSEGEAPGQAVEKAQSSAAHGSDQTPDKNSSEAHSGVGRQDGQKDLKEAEQLQAMGKLAEIIGKRSANVSGDITLETPSGKQRLQTDYSARVGHHADLGGEVNRNEVPLMYQQYIRAYMDQVHKQPASPQ